MSTTSSPTSLAIETSVPIVTVFDGDYSFSTSSLFANDSLPYSSLIDIAASSYSPTAVSLDFASSSDSSSFVSLDIFNSSVFSSLPASSSPGYISDLSLSTLSTHPMSFASSASSLSPSFTSTVDSSQSGLAVKVENMSQHTDKGIDHSVKCHHELLKYCSFICNKHVYNYFSFIVQLFHGSDEHVVQGATVQTVTLVISSPLVRENKSLEWSDSLLDPTSSLFQEYSTEVCDLLIKSMTTADIEGLINVTCTVVSFQRGSVIGNAVLTVQHDISSENFSTSSVTEQTVLAAIVQYTEELVTNGTGQVYFGAASNITIEAVPETTTTVMATEAANTTMH
uniref:SEA domain-containing protein n=1 Tax=Trichobilharzia regenti TaxID=157069 RepID=A0AA85JA41_TRIRE